MKFSAIPGELLTKQEVDATEEITKCLYKLGVDACDEADVDSVPRMTAMDPTLNLSPVVALDLKVPKAVGEPWVCRWTRM